MVPALRPYWERHAARIDCLLFPFVLLSFFSFGGGGRVGRKRGEVDCIHLRHTAILSY